MMTQHSAVAQEQVALQMGSSPIGLSPVAPNIVYMLFEDFLFIHLVFIAQKSSLK